MFQEKEILHLKINHFNIFDKNTNNINYIRNRPFLNSLHAI